MELREIVAVLKRERWLFLSIVGVIIVVAVIWQQLQPPLYQANQMLNVGRTGAASTSEYTFDSFYRLQADERFADTVVRWLGAPRVVEDVSRAAAEQNKSKRPPVELQGGIEAGRLSSQMIELEYRARDEASLQELAIAIPTVLNRLTETLNRENREANWFVIVPTEPIIRDARVPLSLTLLVSLIAGVFLAFWIVLVRHYFRASVAKPQG